MSFPTPRPQRRRAGRAAVALLIVGPAAAQAQITAQEVRDAFEETYEAIGMTVEVGAEEAGDGAVTLSDVVMSFEFTDEGEPDGPEAEPEETVRVEAAFERIAFEETPGGGVRVALPPEGDMTVTTTAAGDGEDGTARLALAAEGAELLVTEAERDGEDGADGGPGQSGRDGADGTVARRYALTADRLAARLVEASRGGEPVEGEFLAAVQGVSTLTTVPQAPAGPGETTRYDQTGEVASVSIRLDLPAGGGPEAEDGPPEDEPPEEPGRLFALAETRELSVSARGTVPGGEAFATFVEEDDPVGALRAGFSVDMSVGYGPGSSETRVTDPSDPAGALTVESTSQGGALDVSLGADGMAVSGGVRAIDYAIEGPNLGVPRIRVGLEEAEIALRTPLLEGEAAEPFELRYLLSGLTLNEEVWATFDPDGLLPREPATLLLDVEGRMRVLADLVGQEAQAEDAMPAEFEEAAVELRLEAAGAALDAQGDFTFDPSDTETFPGVPAPTGELTVEASGIDELLDTLSEMGLVPPDQLMPARMMLGLFARPDGSGGYLSEIEVDGATGSVTANGQRLR